MEINNSEDKLYCPKCGSSQLVANKKGYSAGKGIGGAVLTGGVGLLAGFIGSNKIRVTCLRCGSVWRPDELSSTQIRLKTKSEISKKSNDEFTDKLITFGFFLLFGIIMLIITSFIEIL